MSVREEPRGLALCQCPRFRLGPPCAAIATQEDMLCDDCRDSKVEFAVAGFPNHFSGSSMKVTWASRSGSSDGTPSAQDGPGT